MRRPSGYTLAELLATIAIAGTLASLALPSYRRQLLVAHRAAARSAMLELATSEAAYLSQRRVYAPTLAPWHPVDAQGCAWFRGARVDTPASRMADYRICARIEGEMLKLAAIPVNAQAQDADCGTLAYDSAGGRGASGPLGLRCWR